MSRKTRILFLCKGIPPPYGGLELYSYELAKSMGRKAFDVTLLAPFKKNIKYKEKGITFLTLGSGNQIILLLKTVLALSRPRHWLKRYDYIFCTSWKMSLPIFILNNLFPKPIISIHGRELFPASSLIKIIVNIIVKNAYSFISVSRYTLDRFESSFPYTKNIPKCVVWNGVSDRMFKFSRKRSPSNKKIKIASISRLVARKNIQTSIEVVHQLIQEGADIEYNICGTGPEESKISKKIKSLQTNKINYLGSVTDDEKLEILNNSDIFLHPHFTADAGRDFEGFGIAIAEAMSMGLIVVCGKDGGTFDFVQNGVTGYLVDGRDKKNIKETIKIAIYSKSIERISEQAISFSKNQLTWNKVANEITNRFIDSNFTKII